MNLTVHMESKIQSLQLNLYSTHQQVYVQIFELQVPVKKKCNFEKSYLPIYNSKLHETATCLFRNKLTTF